MDGTTFYPLPCTPINGGSAVESTFVPGIWLVTVAGLFMVRCVLGGTVTGAITVTGLGTEASA